MRGLLTVALLIAPMSVAGVVYGWSPEPLCALNPDQSMCLPSGVTPMCGTGELVNTVGRHRSTRPPTKEEALTAWQRAAQLAEAGRSGLAILNLRIVEHVWPALRGRIALEQGRLLLTAGRVKSACETLERAAADIDSSTRVQAQVEQVRCNLRLKPMAAKNSVDRLLAQYPELPQAQVLQFELAEAEERAGKAMRAALLYRRIDLLEPGSEVASAARDRLTALEANGIRVPPWTLTERIERAERLLNTGPLSLAEREIGRLTSDRSVSAEFRPQVAALATRLARMEGREQGDGPLLASANAEHAPHTAMPAEERERLEAAAREKATARIRRLTGRKPFRRLPTFRLLHVLEIAAPAKLEGTCTEIVEMLARRKIVPAVRLQAAVSASGAAEPRALAALLEPAVGDRGMALAARYHYARALERSGQLAEAERHYLEVIRAEVDEPAYYGLWAGQRLWTVRGGLLGGAPFVEPAPVRDLSALRPDFSGVKLASAALNLPRSGAMTTQSAPAPVDFEVLAGRLSDIADEHGEAYPWLHQAYALLNLHEGDKAANALYEVYLAWRAAIGRPAARAGLESVARGQSRAPERVTWQTRNQRRRLGADARQAIADIAVGLGDFGTAVGLVGWSAFESSPRPYGDLVRRAAQKYRVDPNLLYAVMRVESTLQPRIVSYAGAIGLMQIMPRTGRLIADALGRSEFSPADLLDPATNIEFAAWYLSSLLERFDEHLPLAIASYNGGPHNVRRWLHEHADTMPLDAFLERIPFTQTHRYVRRVLRFYAMYRDEDGLPLPRLSTRLPRNLAPDPVGF